MPTPTLSFAKIVATPTPTSWSQVYNAGGLFAVLSLTSEDESESLATDGKKFLDNLQAEFFGLEEKTFEAITKAVEDVLTNFSTEATLSLSLCFCKDTVLYAYLKGNGAITLKRGEKIGQILKATDNPPDLLRASGYLQTDDLILLQTAQFTENITSEKLKEALENTLPNDIAEVLSPSVHNGEHGGSSAVIISFKGAPPVIEEDKEDDRTIEQVSQMEETPHFSEKINLDKPTDEVEKEEEERELPTAQKAPSPLFTALTSLKNRLPSSFLALNNKQKIGALLAVIILILLSLSIIVFKNNQAKNEQRALFNDIYPKALSQYEEGEALLSLNKSLAEEDFIRARETLSPLKGKLPSGSDEEKKVKELDEKINRNISGETQTSQKEAKSEELSSFPVLEELTQKNVLATTESEDTIYSLTSSGISDDEETLIDNDDAWSRAVSLGYFSGNFYILDQNEGVIKYVPAGDGYAQSTYFKGDAPDLTKGVSLAIDSSIYILTSDGKVTKYTRGEKDAFQLTGLKTPLSSPRFIYTNADIDNIYILDSGNSRVIKVEKNGAYAAEYKSSILKNAKAITVSDNEKTLGILSDGKAYSLSL